MPIRVPAAAGKPYRPSNGTEGDMFQAMFCERCKHGQGEIAPEDTCDILMYTMLYDKSDSNYPKQWIFDAEGRPTCTAFEPTPSEGE